MSFDAYRDDVLEFLKFNGYNKALETFLKEEKTVAQPKAKPVPGMDEKDYEMFSWLCRANDYELAKTRGEKKMEEDYKQLQTKHSSVMLQAKAIFQIAINCL